MNSDRIKEIQETTAYPESTSVMLALKQVWNECEQEKTVFAATHVDIDDIAYDFKDRHEASVKEAANIANKHLDTMGIEQ